MRFPVNQPYVITTYFDPVAHPGLDIAPIPAGATGVQCFAPESSTVVVSAYIAALEGHYVLLQGDSGMFYYFGHFQKRLVDMYQRVSEGQPIGVLGKTGLATGIHTHHEVRRTRTGQQVDPAQYYKNAQEGGGMASQEYNELATIINTQVDSIDKRITALAEGSKATHDDMYKIIADMNKANKATHDDIYKLLKEINVKLK